MDIPETNTVSDLPTIEEMMAQVQSETLEETLDRLQPAMDEMNERSRARQAWMRSRYDMRHFMVRRWTHSGLLCGISVNPNYGLNGYVRLPKPLFDITENYDSLPVDCHGSLTYGPDAGRWVGFDTAHSGDLWPWREVAPYIGLKYGTGSRGRPATQRLIFRHRLNYGGCGIVSPGLHSSYSAPWERTWDAHQIGQEVNHLADQIKQLAQGEQLHEEA